MKKLSNRAKFYSIVLVVPLIVDVLFFLLLRVENPRPDLPALIRFGGPVIVYVAAVWWLLTHLPRNAP